MRRNLFSRLRFKLSTLLIVISALCIWLGYQVYHARVQREAVAAITAAGGTVHYDHEQWPYLGKAERPAPSWVERVFGIDFVHSVVWVRLSDDATGVDAVLAKVSHLPKLRELFLGGDVTDDGLRHLTKCSRLETLSFPSTAVTDRGLPFVGEITSLRYLDVGNTRITSDGLKHLTRLQNLEYLHLWGDQITDEAMQHVAQLQNLQQLHIQHSRVTTDGLEHVLNLAKLRALCVSPASLDDRAVEIFKQLQNLDWLAISGAGLSKSALKELKKSRPEVGVH